MEGGDGKVITRDFWLSAGSWQESQAMVLNLAKFRGLGRMLRHCVMLCGIPWALAGLLLTRI